MARRSKDISRAAGTRGGYPAARTEQDGASAAVGLSEPLLDCAAAAELLSVRVSWVRDAARLGHLPCLRVGRHLRFTRVMLEEWLVEQFDGSAEQQSRPAAVGAGAAAPRRARVAFRPSTEAALLASLAETPNGRKGADGNGR
jgi:excisionase family DNA binding protein